MHLLAPAKINVHLRVGPRRSDGFHPLLSWMSTVGLFDTLILQERLPGCAARPATVRRPGGAPHGTITLACDMPALPCDERNLVLRIAQAWRGVVRGDRDANAGGEATLEVMLQKRIPLGAGLGGGSSDAARMLLGLNRLWASGRAADELSAFAARLGSDLPFFFHGPSSICAGRGERVTPLPLPRTRWATLILPRLSMPTADVYRRFDEMGLGRDEDVADAPDWHAWAALASDALLPRLVNDLERPAFDLAPPLGALRSRIERLAGRPVRMSGSGSSLFTLFDDHAASKALAGQVGRDTGETAIAVELGPAIDDDARNGPGEGQ